MYRRYTVKLYPNQATKTKFETWQNHCRFVWNIALEQRLDAWRKGKFPSCFDQQKQLTELKKECIWLHDSPAYTLQKVLSSLDLAMKACWRKRSRCPRFKSEKRGDYTAMHMRANLLSIKNGFLSIEKAGLVRFRGLKKIPGELKYFNLIKRAGNWYASLMVKIEDTSNVHPFKDKSVGIDRGVIDLVADSAGNSTPNPKYYHSAMKSLAQASKKLAKCKKGSTRRNKAKLGLSKLHKHVADQRHDFLHKLSTNYAKNHGMVVIEKLQTSNMVRCNTGLARSIMDAGWGKFALMLEYKLEERGGKLLQVLAAYTSQQCSKCGHIAQENRKGKVFSCVSCFHVEDSDVNAAKNILAKGLSLTNICAVSTIVEGEVTSPVKREVT